MEHLMADASLSRHDQLTFETAAAQACTQGPIVAPTASAGEIRQALLGQQYESATHIVVCAQNTFLGILRIEDLLATVIQDLLSILIYFAIITAIVH